MEEDLDEHPVSDDDSPVTKRSKRAPDRLSELPDLAIVHILSYLYFEEAVKTSVLSKRFNSLWNSVTGLNFSDDSSGKTGHRFVNFVDAALGFHRRCDVEKFSVKFKYDSNYSKAVGGWIKSVSKKQVKSLHLNFVQNRLGVRDEYKLPKFLYCNKKLIELVTVCCKFTKTKKISWDSLRILSITRTKLSEELIARILCGCPVLETLELKDWSGFDRVKIDSASLRLLRIVGEQQPNFLIEPEDECLLEISGPNLESLEISGPLHRTKVRLMDIGSLVNATMDFEIRPLSIGRKFSWFVVREQDIAREVLESLCLVNKLTVGGWLIKVLSSWEAYNLPSPWSDRKSLTLSIPVARWDHPGIANLLRSSPDLETLIIRMSSCSDLCGLLHYNVYSKNQNEDYYWASWSTISKCPLLHLQTVKVLNFQASCGATELFNFLQFLVRNSKALQEIVIQASKYVTKEALNEAMKLISIPTASPDVVVQFEPPHLWVDPHCICQKSADY